VEVKRSPTHTVLDYIDCTLHQIFYSFSLSCYCGFFLPEQGRLVTGLVRGPVLALAVAVAVARSSAWALLESCRPGSAAGAVGALVQLEPQVGVGGVSWHQSTLDTTLAVDAGIDGLVLVHAHSQVQKHSLERLVVQSMA
jgi:hypothetical protein